MASLRAACPGASRARRLGGRTQAGASRARPAAAKKLQVARAFSSFSDSFNEPEDGLAARPSVEAGLFADRDGIASQGGRRARDMTSADVGVVADIGDWRMYHNPEMREMPWKDLWNVKAITSLIPTSPFKALAAASVLASMLTLAL
eukprot:CAMPEP_0182874254 /NCGR_PEP_ID=MMETSP0034_2-20130328/12835_1 /TAXON_ID=156128 /ORGANISM="Nephroselmis pyriformis, Strain CCMP717" /LENGTH=146 /DNA_ID=CAMNT_0025006957 /DNA_START=15 /DNA_END=455 /DNA_ORIENTATION=-